MRWPYLEYVLKGLFLGLVVYAALQVGIEPAAMATASPPCLRFNLPLLLGLVLALSVAAVTKMRQGYQIKGRALFFFILLLLESHTLVYLGVIGGAIVGACLVLQWHTTDLLWQVLGGGAVLGVIFVLQRLIRARLIRLSVILVVASALATGLFLVADLRTRFGAAPGIARAAIVRPPAVAGDSFLLCADVCWAGRRKRGRNRGHVRGSRRQPEFVDVPATGFQVARRDSAGPSLSGVYHADPACLAGLQACASWSESCSHWPTSPGIASLSPGLAA